VSGGAPLLLALLGCGLFEEIAADFGSLDGGSVGPSIDCDERDGPAPNRCLSGKLRCGDVVSGTTRGGESKLGRDFYAHAFCFPAVDGHEGPERVYLLQAPPNQDITLTLESPCGDLDVAALAFAYEGGCPTASHPIAECKANSARGGGTVRLNTFHARDYLVVVDGKDEAEGAFNLRVDCAPLVR
jgi:hypothetical protein